MILGGPLRSDYGFVSGGLNLFWKVRFGVIMDYFRHALAWVST